MNSYSSSPSSSMVVSISPAHCSASMILDSTMLRTLLKTPDSSQLPLVSVQLQRRALLRSALPHQDARCARALHVEEECIAPWVLT